jgi:molybdenum cofactor biosynthesis protein B
VHAGIGWLTVSDTRTAADDRSGDLALEKILAAGHRVVDRAIVPDEPERVRERVRDWLGNDDVQIILVSGGTGISSRDRTHEALAELFETQLTGFGELFRMLSYEQVGSRSMLSRASAGIVGGKPVFLMPGSTKAVELALTSLILPEIPHLLAELAR